jgi:conjugative relaxase-like TrwC/TraI family protein
MLSVAKLAAPDYFLNLAGDYYQSGFEPAGRWIGQGAAAAGLTGIVDKEAFRQLVRGFAPDGRKLVQNAGSEKRQTAWDLTFSADKTASVLWSQGSPSVRQEIEAGHHTAVEAALRYFEDHVAWTRRGKGGAVWERARLVAAAFEHSSSRAGDPQLHTHLVVLNLAVRRDGTVGTLVSKPIYANKMLLGALYRAELAVQLQRRLGLDLERRGAFFGVAGIPRALVRRFSTRRREIEDVAGDRDIYSAAGMDAVTIATRKAKRALSRDALFARWEVIGEEYGFTARQVQALIGQARAVTPGDTQALFRDAMDEILYQESHFNRATLLRRAAEQAPGSGLDVAALEAGLDRFLTTTPEIVKIQEDRFTTLAAAREEQILKERGEAMQQDSRHVLSGAVVARAIKAVEREESRKQKKSYALTAEQKEAISHITATRGSLKLVNGKAGTGKTAMLDAARRAWEAQGYTVLGASLSARAARGLEEGSGIRSCTLRRLELDLAHRWTEDLRHHAVQLARAAQGKPTYKPFTPRSLDRNTILVVDESSLVGTRVLASLVEAVKRAGAKLVLIGDEDQLQPIEAGGPFRALLTWFKPARLTEIVRQEEVWGREAVRQFSCGEAGTALAEFVRRGLLHVADTRSGAIEKLITDWAVIGVTRPQEALIFTATREERALLNRLAQEARQRAGALGRLGVHVGGNAFHERDRILFTQNSRKYNVDNGTMGAIDSIDLLRRTMTVRLDAEQGKRARYVTISYRKYKEIDLAYAITTHKGQGMTVNRAFLLAGGAMTNREMTYVQASRARHETRIYCDAFEAGPELTTLTRAMNRSEPKELAILPLEQERRIAPRF